MEQIIQQINNFFKTKNSVYVGIEGLIGIGKTTLQKTLQEYFQKTHNIIIIPEEFDEELLAWCQKDWKTRCFGYQIRAFFKKKNQLFEIKALHGKPGDTSKVCSSSEKTLIIMDRTYLGDLSFIEFFRKSNELDEESYKQLLTIYQKEGVPKYDIVINLIAPIEKCLERIKERNRKSDLYYTLEFLQKLIKCYEISYSFLDKENIIVVDWTSFGKNS